MTAALAFLYGGALLVIGVAWGICAGLRWLAELDDDIEV